MDPVTHYMAGYFLGRRKGASKEQLMLLTLASTLPDLDAVFILGGVDAFSSFHRGFTHSIIGSLIIIVALTALYMYLTKGKSWTRVGYWVSLGVGSHLVLDMFTLDRSFFQILRFHDLPPTMDHYKGVSLLWPLSDAKFSLVSMNFIGQVMANVLVVVLFILAVAYAIRRIRQNDRPWEIWTDPIKNYIRKKREGEGGGNGEDDE